MINKIISRTPSLNTVSSLTEDMKKLGLQKGMSLIVHSSLSSIGWIAGGPVAFIEALMNTVTDEGTIVMPTHSSDLSDPKNWQAPPVPESWWQEIRDSTPVFDVVKTPTRHMGQIVECFRTWPGVTRSVHPLNSFAAWGKNAAFVTAGHSLSFSMGEQSPLSKLYELNGSVLLVGVGHDRNTSLHLAESRAGKTQPIQEGAPVIENGNRIWKVYEDLAYDADAFNDIGEAFDRLYNTVTGTIGIADCKLMKQKELVDFGKEWLLANII